VLPGKKYTVDEVIWILLRRKWLIMLPAVLGVAGSVAVARKIAPVYRSETLIMVVPQRIPDTYVKPTVSQTPEERMSSISDQILSRSRLEPIITDLNLYPELRARGIMEDVVHRMRNDIRVWPEGKESLRVNYISTDPNLAQQVTARLAGWVIEENIRYRASVSESANQFLDSQLADAKRRLVEHEKKLEEYRERFAGQLPSQLQGNLQAIANAQLQLQALSESLNRARERRLMIERQIGDAETFPVAATTDPAPVPAATADNVAAMTTAQQLELAQNRLAVLKMRLTEDHPDVRTTERNIRELQAKLEDEGKRAPAVAPTRPVSQPEQLRQKRLRDLRGEMQVVEHQIEVSEAEEGRLKRVLGDYQAKVDAVPSRESELVELTRDYGTLQSTYASLLEKREESKLAANLERNQIGEQFKILDPASLPERPYNRKQRLTVLAGGSLAGLVFGLAIVALLEIRDSSFKAEDDVLRVLTLPVLALVPVIISDEQRRADRRRRWWLEIALGAVVLAIGSAAVIAWKLQL
jgi:polysaccharide chain length determinant protein (PEP-CTERM system associated)